MLVSAEPPLGNFHAIRVMGQIKGAQAGQLSALITTQHASYRLLIGEASLGDDWEQVFTEAVEAIRRTGTPGILVVDTEGNEPLLAELVERGFTTVQDAIHVL